MIKSPMVFIMFSFQAEIKHYKLTFVMFTAAHK